MKGHVKLDGLDLLVVRDPQQGFLYQELHAIPEDIVNVLAQGGCVRIGDNRFAFTQSDFSGGMGQKVMKLGNCVDDITVGVCRPPSDDSFDTRIWHGKAIARSVNAVIGRAKRYVTCGKHVYVVTTNRRLVRISDAVAIIATDVVDAFEHSGMLYVDFGLTLSRYRVSDSGDIELDATCSKPQTTVCASLSPFVGKFNDDGSISVIRPSLMGKPCAVTLGATDGSGVEIVRVHPAVSLHRVRVQTSPCSAAVYPVVASNENGKPDLFTVNVINAAAMNSGNPDVLVIEYVGNVSVSSSNSFRGYGDSGVPVNRYELSLLGLNEASATGWVVPAWRNRVSRGVNWLHIGEYDASSVPQQTTRIQRGFHKMALPIVGWFKLYWASGANIFGSLRAIYYSFHVGEDINLAYLCNNAPILQGGSAIGHVASLQVAEMFDPGDKLNVGDRWYVQFVPAGSVGVVNERLPACIPGTMKIVNQVRRCSGTFVSVTKATTDYAPGLVGPSGSSGYVTVDQDITFSCLSECVCSVDPIYGGRVPANTVLELEYWRYGDGVAPKFLPGELAGARLVVPQVKSGVGVTEYAGYEIADNAAATVFCVAVPARPAITVKNRPTAAIVEDGDTYVMRGMFSGSPVLAKPVAGQVALLTRCADKTKLYFCDTVSCGEYAEFDGTPLDLMEYGSGVLVATRMRADVVSVYAPNVGAVLSAKGTRACFFPSKHGVLCAVGSKCYCIGYYGIWTPYWSENGFLYCDDDKAISASGDEPYVVRLEFTTSMYDFGGKPVRKRLHCVRIVEFAARGVADVVVESDDGRIVVCRWDSTEDAYVPVSSFEFNWLIVKYSAQSSVTSVGAISVEFEVIDKYERVCQFSFPVNENLRGLGGEKIDLRYRHIRQLCNAPREVKFVDLEGVERKAIVKSIAVRGVPGRNPGERVDGGDVPSGNEMYPWNSYVATVTLLLV